MSLLVLLAAAAAPAAASDASISETRRMIHQYGDCVVRRQLGKASQAILSDLDKDMLLKRFPTIVDSFCVPTWAGQATKIAFRGDHYRYALAEALVRREFAQDPALDLTRLPPLVRRPTLPMPGKVDSKGRPFKPEDYARAVEAHRIDQAYRFVSVLGECVVRAKPADARALMFTAPSSAAEDSVFQALTPAFGQCLTSGSVELGKVVLRGVLAVNYYRLAKQAGQGAAS